MNNNLNVYTVREFVLEECKFDKPEEFGKFHKSYLNYDNSKSVIIQSPRMDIRSINDNLVELTISRNKDRHKEFFHLFSHLEDMAILNISSRSQEWFNKKIDKSFVEMMFRSCIHKGLDIDDPFIFKSTCSSHLCQEFQQNQTVICLIKIDGIVFGQNSVKLDFKVVQMKQVETEKIVEKVDFEKNSVHVENQIFEENASVMPTNFQDEKVIQLEKSASVAQSNYQDEKVIHLEKKEEPKEDTHRSVTTKSVSENDAEKYINDNKRSVSSVVDSQQMSIISEMLKALASNDQHKIKELASLLK